MIVAFSPKSELWTYRIDSKSEIVQKSQNHQKTRFFPKRINFEKTELKEWLLTVPGFPRKVDFLYYCVIFIQAKTRVQENGVNVWWYTNKSRFLLLFPVETAKRLT